MHEDLNLLGLIDEEDIALDGAALSLAALDHPGTDLSAYQDLLDMVETGSVRPKAPAGNRRRVGQRDAPPAQARQPVSLLQLVA